MQKTIPTLIHYLWPRGLRNLQIRVVLSLMLLAGSRLARVCIPMVYKWLADQLALPAISWSETIALGIALYSLMHILSYGCNEAKDVVFAKVLYHGVRQAAVTTFNHLHLLSLRFHLDRRMGSLNRTIERGLKGIEDFLDFSVFRLCPIFIEVLLTTGILLVMFPWQLGAITIATLVVYVAYTFTITQWRMAFFRAKNEADSEANTKAIDSLLNYETVKYFNNENLEEQRYNQSLESFADAATKNKIGLATLNFGQGFIIAVGLGVLMWCAARGVIAKQLTIGDFVMVNAYMLQLYVPLNILGFAYREMKQALINMEQMFSLMETPVEVSDKPTAEVLRVGSAAICFKEVGFSYDGVRPILQDVSFTVPAGKMVAIVGGSGGGKSTLVRLLFRFYDVGQGSITIDGQDIRDVTQASLRAAIGIVPQDTVLFNDSIYYNIWYARPSATQAEVEAAAKMAQLHDFIQRLPKGYETIVGERGLKLSGGEKQRVAIARVLLKQPKILVFDEATSALDTHTEREIQHSLRQIAEKRTTLVIAHRLSTIVDADEIIVLEHGRIVERGTHTQLLAAGGAYKALWEKQFN